MRNCCLSDPIYGCLYCKEIFCGGCLPFVRTHIHDNVYMVTLRTRRYAIPRFNIPTGMEPGSLVPSFRDCISVDDVVRREFP